MLLEEHSIGFVLTQFSKSLLTRNDFESLSNNKPYNSLLSKREKSVEEKFELP